MRGRKRRANIIKIKIRISSLSRRYRYRYIPGDMTLGTNDPNKLHIFLRFIVGNLFAAKLKYTPFTCRQQTHSRWLSVTLTNCRSEMDVKVGAVGTSLVLKQPARSWHHLLPLPWSHSWGQRRDWIRRLDIIQATRKIPLKISISIILLIKPLRNQKTYSDG